MKFTKKATQPVQEKKLSSIWTIEELGAVDASDMIHWIKLIDLEDWPQQSRTELKPAMVSNLEWREFGTMMWPIVQELGFNSANTYQHMLSVVMPGHDIPPHKDQQADYWKFRVHVPLLGNKESFTVMDDGKHFMEVGKAYKVNVKATHSVYNDGKTPRIHFMFDVR